MFLTRRGRILLLVTSSTAFLCKASVQHAVHTDSTSSDHFDRQISAVSVGATTDAATPAPEVEQAPTAGGEVGEQPEEDEFSRALALAERLAEGLSGRQLLEDYFRFEKHIRCGSQGSVSIGVPRGRDRSWDRVAIKVGFFGNSNPFSGSGATVFGYSFVMMFLVLEVLRTQAMWTRMCSHYDL